VEAMVMKSLILGVLFSVGLFAVKSGVGLSYCLAGNGRLRNKVGSVLLFSFTYLLVFSTVVYILQQIDFTAHLDTVQQFLQSGMLVHLVIAALMIVWGILLLKRDCGAHENINKKYKKSKSWLILAMPCPVCFTVILFSAAVVLAMYPDHFLRSGLIFYGVFMVISLFTPVLVHLFGKKALSSPDSFLGGAMLLIAVYFFLSATIMPQFAELDQIYRMASFKGDAQPVDIHGLVGVALVSAAVFLVGYGYTNNFIRRRQ
jgi:predicted transporter